MKNQKKTVTEQDVVTAIAAFQTEVKQAIGAETERPLFKGFKVNDGIQLHYQKALDNFVDGEFVGALKEVKEGRSWLSNSLRVYCHGSVNTTEGVTVEDSPKFFDKAINALPVLDKAHTAELKSLYDAYVAIATKVRVAEAVSLEDASNAYWALLDAITAAPQRNETRNRQAARERDQAQRQAREQREQQVKNERRGQREQVAKGFASLATMFSSNSASA